MENQDLMPRSSEFYSMYRSSAKSIFLSITVGCCFFSHAGMAQASQGESDLLPETANSAIDDLANEASLADTPDRLIASKDGDDQPTESFVEFPTETDSSEIFQKPWFF
ncbi:MAG: hypothetical protein HC873_12475 [Leptolyngbyaceae cyanobacterium SL_1_1]|nr:hypothetical protein [Leptolyngbyaceae cyanobacterium SL_1_1]